MWVLFFSHNPISYEIGSFRKNTHLFSLMKFIFIISLTLFFYLNWQISLHGACWPPLLSFSTPRTLPKYHLCYLFNETYHILLFKIKTALSLLMLKPLSAVLLLLHPLTFYIVYWFSVSIVVWLLTLFHKLLQNKVHCL